MKNKIIVGLPQVKDNTIKYTYEVSGVWKEAFKLNEEFFIEYSCSVEEVPAGVAIIPLVANILPMSWVYDAEIVLPVCDKDFYDSIPEFKKGYIDMYPMMELKGKLTVKEIEENVSEREGTAAFFSGGVDSFNTLVNHAEEKPILFTLWGSDITFEDEKGWSNVRNHLEQVANDFSLEYVTIKSCFRRFLDEAILSEKVKNSGDGWWHGFQHGIGLISHSAPVMYKLNKKTVYIASTYTMADKGKITCASDFTIDNFLRFCSCNVIHDGYEFTRQMKTHNITEYSSRTGTSIKLRVCWESAGGTNCCNCEKCWRTILGVRAEGKNPKDFGFDYTKKQLRHLSFKMRYGGKMTRFMEPLYSSIKETMIQNNKKSELEKEIRWFYDANICSLVKPKWWYKAAVRIRRKLM